MKKDAEAQEQMLNLTGGNRTVPAIVKEGKPIQVGWMGQGCFIQNPAFFRRWGPCHDLAFYLHAFDRATSL
jgi:hypothetical protein